MRVHQRPLVQQSFASIQPIADAAAILFYSRLFTLDPSLRLMFRGDMREQGRKFMHILEAAVVGLDRPDTLMPMVQALGRRHAAYGATPEHYAVVGEALIWMLEYGLGPEFTKETRQAWIEVYLDLATTMQTPDRGDIPAG
jgi:nitric oxide dioxygenase